MVGKYSKLLLTSCLLTALPAFSLAEPKKAKGGRGLVTVIRVRDLVEEFRNSTFSARARYLRKQMKELMAKVQALPEGSEQREKIKTLAPEIFTKVRKLMKEAESCKKCENEKEVHEKHLEANELLDLLEKTFSSAEGCRCRDSHISYLDSYISCSDVFKGIKPKRYVFSR